MTNEVNELPAWVQENRDPTQQEMIEFLEEAHELSMAGHDDAESYFIPRARAFWIIREEIVKLNQRIGDEFMRAKTALADQTKKPRSAAAGGAEGGVSGLEIRQGNGTAAGQVPNSAARL